MPETVTWAQVSEQFGSEVVKVQLGSDTVSVTGPVELWLTRVRAGRVLLMLMAEMARSPADWMVEDTLFTAPAWPEPFWPAITSEPWL